MVALLTLGVAACTFPDVGLEPGVGGGGPALTTGSSSHGVSTGDVASSGQGGSSSSSGSGGGTSSAGPASGGGDTTAATTGQGGDGGTGQGGDGGTGQGGDGGTGQGGDGGTTASSASTSNATTSSSSTGGGGCPVGCEACNGDCPAEATPDDCDADGDPDVGDAPDCHRCNDRVRHGQTTYFVDPYVRLQGGTSFDYNCNGNADRQYPLDSDGCAALGPCAANIVYALPALPACGQPATFQVCNEAVGLTCANGVTANSLAGCR